MSCSCLFFVPASLLLSTIVAATSAHSETLEDALIEAYQSNPTILAERAHLRVIDEGVPQALASWRPTVTLSGGGGYETVTTPPAVTIPGLTSQVSNSVSAWTPNWDFKVTQPVYDGGRTVAQTSVAELNIEAERAHLVATEVASFYSVAQAYLDVVRDQDLYDLAVDNEKTLRSELEGFETQLKSNMVTDPDKLQVDAQYASASALRSQAEGALGVSRDEFLFAVGHLPSRLQAPTLRSPMPSSRDKAMQLAARNNPNVISAMFLEDAGAKTIEVVRGQLLPSLGIVGDYSQTFSPATTGITSGLTNDASLMAVVTVPLYEAGTVYSQTRQAQQNFKQLQHQTDVARITAVEAAGQAWDVMQAARDALPPLIHATEAAKAASEGIYQEAVLGTQTITSVLVAESAQYLVNVALVTAQHNAALAQFGVAQQLGVLTPTELKLVVPLYDVDRHYLSIRDKWLGFGSDDK